MKGDSMTEKKKEAPPPAETFTLKDYQEMRRFSQDMEKAINQAMQDRLTPEEWDEASKELNETGELSAKFKNRIGIKKFKSQPAKPVIDDAGNPVKNDDGTVKLEPDMTQPPEITLRVYEIAERKLTDELNRLGKKYKRIIAKVSATEAPDKKINIHRARTIMQKLLNTPEATQTLEKLDAMHLAPIDGMPGNEVLLFLFRVLNLKNGYQILEKNPNTKEQIKLPTANKGAIIFTRKTRNSTVEVKIRHVDEILTHRVAFNRMFLFVLQKMNQQNYPSIAKISLHEMVDLGMYQSIKTAKKQLFQFIELQRNIGISGKIKKGRKQISSVNNIINSDPDAEKEGIGVTGTIFGNGYEVGKYVYIAVNVNFNTDFLSTYFTYFHRDGHMLKGNAQALYFYICCMARQKTDKIKETGAFIITVESARIFLNLPSVKNIQEDAKNNEGKKYNGDYKRHIVMPIESAIDEITDVIKETPEAQNLGFTLTILTDYYDTDDYMDFLNGKIEIGMAGEYAKPLLKVAEKKKKKRRQRERAIERETAKLIASSQLKKESKNQKNGTSNAEAGTLSAEAGTLSAEEKK